jgi:hypothetical protein
MYATYHHHQQQLVHHHASLLQNKYNLSVTLKIKGEEVDASGAFDETEQQTAMIRMTQAGVIVTDYNAIVIEMLANNADPLAAQVYAAIGLSHFVSMRDIYGTMTTYKKVPPIRGTQ